MHEMQIAIDIVNHAVAVAEQNDAVRIDEIEVRVGVMRLVVPEALELAFAAASEGTLAAGAILRIDEERAAAVCGACGRTFEPQIDQSFACPACGQANAHLIAGNDIVLKTVVCQTDDEVAAS